MAISQGTAVSDIVARVATDISDPDHNRWTSAQIVAFFNEAVRELAWEGAFRREDLQVPTANQRYFSTFAEPVRINYVKYGVDQAPVKANTAEDLDKNVGQGWRDDLAADPAYYVPMRDGVQLVPGVTTAGTALTFSGGQAITEAAGGQLDGDSYIGASNSGDIVHFRWGDGYVTNDTTADNNVLINYDYYPRPVSSSDTIPTRYAQSLVEYGKYKAFAISELVEEVQAAGVAYQAWIIEKSMVLSNIRQRNFSSEWINKGMSY